MTGINNTDNTNNTNSSSSADASWGSDSPSAAAADAGRPRLRWWHVAIIVVSVLAVTGIGGFIMIRNKLQQQEQDAFQQEMVNIVHSSECRKLIEDGLKTFDPDALTDKGVIKTYKIDESSIKHNPMGGIEFRVVINGNEKLTISYSINKPSFTFDEEHPDGKLTDEGGVTSKELVTLLEKRYGKGYLER